ncbi:MAG: 50S ribosomal protein L22 [Thermomicrobia bacterium]|nr:50S ribosomal protein L22 [Thermomicrobia bacterium]MCA1722834.1 50S ribosomal protein L22 [Thermomicrobia bacterium]
MATVQPTTRVRAVAKDVHISPQKVRLVIDQVRGKRVNEALAILRFLPQGAADEVARVVRSASANAEHNNDMDPEDLVIALAYADEGMKLKRFTARSRGRPGPILKRFSHITIVVEERPRPVRGARVARPAARRGANPTGRGRSQTPAVSRPRVPARAEAPGKIETLAPKPAPEETIETPSAALEAASPAENIETTPPPIEATQAKAEATEIADSGLAQPRDQGGERRNEQ